MVWMDIGPLKNLKIKKRAITKNANADATLDATPAASQRVAFRGKCTKARE